MSVFEDRDREFFARELDSFLPDRVFDAHTHVWHRDLADGRLAGGPEDIDYAGYRQAMEELHPGRHGAGLFLPSFKHRQFAKSNQWVADCAAAAADCRGMFFVTPTDDPEWVRQEVGRLGLHGLKCYHTMSPTKPTWESQIPDYLPEELVKVAHEEKWAITLHMVKARAVADPGNIHWIRHYCKTYPDMRLILAHGARGFQPEHNLEGLPLLTGFENLYFDTSVNCEPMAHQAIIRIMGHGKLMYGTDLPVSHSRGRSVGVADSFLWLYDQSPVWEEEHQTIQPLPIGMEHLRALKWACWSERLTDTQIEDIFWNNAARLFDL